MKTEQIIGKIMTKIGYKFTIISLSLLVIISSLSTLFLAIYSILNHKVYPVLIITIPFLYISHKYSKISQDIINGNTQKQIFIWFSMKYKISLTEVVQELKIAEVVHSIKIQQLKIYCEYLLSTDNFKDKSLQEHIDYICKLKDLGLKVNQK